MSQRGGRAGTKAKPAADQTVSLRLFVAGDEPNSKLARENLARICQSHLDGRHNLEIVDVFEDYQPALDDGVFVTPALIRVSPPPRVTLLGCLSDTPKVLAALRLTGGD